MKLDFTLTSAQQTLVEENLPLIDKVLGLSINTYETVCGLG